VSAQVVVGFPEASKHVGVETLVPGVLEDPAELELLHAASRKSATPQRDVFMPDEWRVIFLFMKGLPQNDARFSRARFRAKRQP
jgi:hypothetical protein